MINYIAVEHEVSNKHTLKRKGQGGRARLALVLHGRRALLLGVPAAPTISGSDPVGAALLLKKPAMLGCLLSGRCTLGCADALAAAAAPPVVTCTLMSTCAPAWAAARACKPGSLIAAERATPGRGGQRGATRCTPLEKSMQ